MNDIQNQSVPRKGHWTAGPWQVAGARHTGDLKIGRDTRLHAIGPDGDAVAMVFFDMKTGRGLQDARLIAAAPDLYEALYEYFYAVHPAAVREASKKAKEALARAAGA